MKKASAFCAMLLDWLPRVTLKEFAVSARNAGTLAKLNVPVPSRKLLLRNCRNSPPVLSEFRPADAVHSCRRPRGCVPSTRWKGRRAAEIESSAGYVDLRQSVRLRNPVPNSEIGQGSIAHWAEFELDIRFIPNRSLIDAAGRT